MRAEERYIKDFLAGYQPYKPWPRWNYEDGCVLSGAVKLYHATQDGLYRDFVLNYLSPRVEADGSIPGYPTHTYSIDDINPGKSLFFAWHETGEERYRKAIEFHFERLMGHPRCACGNFWHKEQYPWQVWLDGLYMAQPFYMAYEKEFDRYTRLSDITAQFRNVRRHLFCDEKQLSYHGWDEKRVQPWCNPETGCSPNFWLRSMGWYVMALADCIGLCSEQLFEHYKLLVDLFRESLRGLLRYQDKASGLFWQVIDLPEAAGNYLETSGSAMACYAVLKGVRLGLLDSEEYLPIGRRIYEGLCREMLKEGEDGKLHLGGICRVAGLGGKEQRDGSVAYYLSEEICCDDSKGVGPFMMATAEYLRAEEAAK